MAQREETTSQPRKEEGGLKLEDIAVDIKLSSR